MLKSVFVIFFILNQLISVEPTSPKLIIDNDAGADDALGIFLALLYEKYYNGSNVIGLTTGNGNTNESNVYINDQRILKVADRQDVPIYRGSKSSLVITPASDSYFGTDGFGDNENNDTGLQPAQAQGAVTTLIEQSKIHEGNLVVITLGALTNVALAIKLDEGFLDRLAHLYVGAGHIQDENFPNAEFNAKMDVEAYHIVTQYANPNKVTVVPFSQVQKTLNISKSWRTDVLGAIDTDVMKAQNLYERVSLAGNKTVWTDLDPAVVAAAIRPDIVEEYKYSSNSITLCGDKRGVNTNVFGEKDNANVRVVYSFKMDEYKKFLLDVFSAELNVNNPSTTIPLRSRRILPIPRETGVN